MATAPKIVLFEDDDNTGTVIERSIRAALGKRGAVIRFDLKTSSQDPRELSRSYDDRISDSFRSKPFRNVTLIVTDRDLSKNEPYRGLSEAVVSRVAAMHGFPIALYARGVRDSVLDRTREWGEGRIILDYAGGPERLGRQAACVASGFDEVRRRLPKARKDRKNNTPAKVLAAILGVANVSDRIALYGAGDQGMIDEILGTRGRSAESLRRQIRLLGYWLWDSIMRFPGLLVGAVSAASYLNIAPSTFQKPAIRKLFANALYDGPFSGTDTPYWWRPQLDAILHSHKCANGRELVRKHTGKLPPRCPCSVDSSIDAGYYCVLTEAPVSLEHSRSVTWFPPGADLSRVSTPAYNERGPWLGEF